MVDNSEASLTEIRAQWVTVRSKIRQKIGDAQFASWIKLLTLESYIDQKVTLSVPSSFIRTRIIEQYLDIIKSYWYVQNLKINDIKIIVTKKEKANLGDLKKESENFDSKKTQDVFKTISSDLDSRFTFSNFIVGKPNELAFAAARRVSESDDVPFNPLFLYGGVGLGKTHLMHAIAHEIKKEPLLEELFICQQKNLCIILLKHLDLRIQLHLKNSLGMLTF